MFIDKVSYKKSNLRKKYLKIRKFKQNKIKDVCDDIIISKLLLLDEYKKSDIIFIYISLPDEVNTKKIFLKALEDKKVIAVPKCIRETNEIKFFNVTSISDMEVGNFKIMEPLVNKCVPILDFNQGLCIVPGISFDKFGYRLGYGKGYYDRFLNMFKGKTVGLCYEKCLASKLPVNEFDRRVDMIITEKKIIM